MLNKMPSQKTALKLEHELKEKGLKMIGSAPNDPELFESCLEGRPLANGEALEAVDKILTRLISRCQLEGHRGSDMCLRTDYLNAESGQITIMKDVARIEAEANGYWLVDLFGKRKFIEDRIQAIELIDNHFIILDGDKAGALPVR